jgi:hypothetical protein
VSRVAKRSAVSGVSGVSNGATKGGVARVAKGGAAKVAAKGVSSRVSAPSRVGVSNNILRIKLKRPTQAQILPRNDNGGVIEVSSGGDSAGGDSAGGESAGGESAELVDNGLADRSLGRQRATPPRKRVNSNAYQRLDTTPTVITPELIFAIASNREALEAANNISWLLYPFGKRFDTGAGEVEHSK